MSNPVSDCYWFVDCDDRGQLVYIYTTNLKVKVDEKYYMGWYAKDNKEIARQYAFEKKDKNYKKLLEKLELTKDNIYKLPRKRKKKAGE